MRSSSSRFRHIDRQLVSSALVLLCSFAAGCAGSDPDPGAATAGQAGTLGASAGAAGTATTTAGAGGTSGGSVGQGGAAAGSSNQAGASAQGGSAGSSAMGGGGATALGGTTSGSGSGAGGQAGAASDSWDSYAKGFMSTYCVSCHDDDKQGSATRDYHLLAAVKGESSEIACGLSKSMADWSGRGCSGFPPARQFPVGDGPKPSDDERDRLIQWIDAGAP